MPDGKHVPKTVSDSATYPSQTIDTETKEQLMRMPLRSGSRATTESTPAVSRWEQEWADAEATDRAEAARALRQRTRALLFLVAAWAAVVALLAAIFPLTPGFSPADAVGGTVAATVTAAVTLTWVPLVDRSLGQLPAAGAGDALVFVAALSSAGAAAIHLAVAKTHFDEYTLFGLFFVGSGLAQLAWPIWLLFRRWRPLLLLGAAGNALIVVLWGVDRIWGLPLGPTPWQPDPVGFGDAATSGFEVLLVAACIALLFRGRGGTLRRVPMLALTGGALALTTLSLLSVIGVGASVLTPTE